MSLLNTFDGDEVRKERELAIKQDATRKARCDDLIARLTKWFPNNVSAVYYEFRRAKESIGDLTISKQDIDDILVSSSRVSQHHGYQFTGLFVSAMIQDAYENGINDFALQTELLTHPIAGMCSSLSGTEDNMIRCTITGNNTINCAYGSHYLHLTTLGDIGDPAIPRDVTSNYSIGIFAQQSHFFIHGYVDTIGAASEFCKYYTTDDSLILRIKEAFIPNEFIRNATLFKIEEDGSYTQVHP